VPRRALLHDHELWDCFGGGDAAPEPENLVSTENSGRDPGPDLMELAADEPEDGGLQELCVPLHLACVC
jgi:hypothetical protein